MADGLKPRSALRNHRGLGCRRSHGPLRRIFLGDCRDVQGAKCEPLRSEHGSASLFSLPSGACSHCVGAIGLKPLPPIAGSGCA